MHPLDLKSDPISPAPPSTIVTPLDVATAPESPAPTDDGIMTPETVLARYERTRRRVSVLRSTVAEFRQRVRDIAADGSGSRGNV